MIHVEVTQPVNDPSQPGQYVLDRDEVWAGLRSKAENAIPFVAGMSECSVLERGPEGLVREVVVHGERIREDVAFQVGQRVSFHRRDDRATWVIHNEIGEDETGDLTLTFAGEVLFHGQAAEAKHDDEAAERMRVSTLRVVRNTLAVIREMSEARAAEHAG
ncbi:SRPBCC family protein [Streptomyces sp. NPDC015220]|uniref:SRPBCC family protein n=1 Tax=Streptomyces sp. NPDC015220 TaxID=3364947 RepID=UPI0036FA3894